MYNSDAYLQHYGVLGMKWGRRRVGITANRQSKFDKADLKKLQNGGHVSIGATKKRQAAFDKRDKESLERSLQARKEKQEQKKQLAEIEKRNKMLNSPKLLAKNLDKFTKEEIDSAVTRMRLNRDLRAMELSEIKSGSEYVNAYLAIGTSAVAAYKLYESPLGQRIAGSIKKALE